MEGKLNHFDAAGNAVMVDVTAKAPTLRTAVAEGTIRVSRPVLEAIASGATSKGDVLGVARVAGIMAAKRTSELIPLCLSLIHIYLPRSQAADALGHTGPGHMADILQWGLAEDIELRPQLPEHQLTSRLHLPARCRAPG